MHVMDVAQGVVQDVVQNAAEDVVHDLDFGARAARALLAMTPPPPPPSFADRDSLSCERNWANSVVFGSGCGQATPGVPRKAQSASMLYAFIY